MEREGCERKMKNQTFIKGTFILTIATFVSKVLGSIFRIPLQNIAGDAVLGIFSLVYPLYMVALILSVAGIPIAISKLISEARAQNNAEEIQRIFRTASLLALSFGFLSFVVLFGAARPIAEWLGGEQTRLSIMIVSTTLLISPYMAVYRGFFQGYEDMRPTAVSQVIEQFVRVVLILAIAYYMVGHHYADDLIAGGVMLGSPLGALASLVYLRFLYVRFVKKEKSKTDYRLQTFWETGKTILSISIPIAIGALSMALFNLVDSVSVPLALKWGDGENVNYLFGLYSRGTSLVQIATVFSSSIVLPLIPLLSKHLANHDEQRAREVIEQSYEWNHFISWPIAFGAAALTVPINIALFTNAEGSAVMAIVLFSSGFTSLALLSTGILQGMNESKKAAAFILVGCAVKFAMNVLFVSLYGIMGAAISTLLVYALLFILNTYSIRKSVFFSLRMRSVATLAFCATVMALVIACPLAFVHAQQWGRFASLMYVAAATLIGAGVYVGLALWLGAVNMDKFRSMVRKKL
ncbi:putative polysaccharide biosynthesis protein [Thermolongibacillus altinsuensis]